MAPKVDIPLALIKSAAVGGIAMVWVNFTLKAFKMAWHIISTSPCEFDPFPEEFQGPYDEFMEEKTN